MAQYRLHCFCQSGNSYKVALYLQCAGLEWEPVLVDFFNGQTRDPGWREAVNEMGEAPVLEDGATRLTQSGVILSYLVDQTGNFKSASEAERREVLRWVLFDNHKFTSYFATLRFLVGIQKTGETPVTEFLRGRTQTAFGMVEKHLAGRDFLLGDRPTIADISMVGYLYYTEETGLDRAPYPNITGWAKRIAALPGWAPPYDLMR